MVGIGVFAGSETDGVARREVASFSIGRSACLDAEGHALGALPAFAHDRDELVGLYRAMWLTRLFDAKAVSLQRTGRLGTFASSLGQEAVSVGVASAMRARDVLVPSFREQGAQLWRGVKPSEILLYWGGDERGSAFSGPVEDFPICIPVGTQAPHAVGVGLAIQLRHEARAAVCVMGDGATSRGDVYEAMNYAGVRRLPVVFAIDNNEWAISAPRSQQTAAATLAQMAIGAGISGEQVDGNDVIAVRAAVEAACARARTGGGPSVIEALTYRLADHTTADDASRYRDDSLVTERWALDPVARLRAFLVSRDWWGRSEEDHLLGACRETIDAEAEIYLATPPLPGAAMFEHLYATLPEPLAPQLADVTRRVREREEASHA